MWHKVWGFLKDYCADRLDHGFSIFTWMVTPWSQMYGQLKTVRYMNCNSIMNATASYA